jgi:uncharacterized protein YceH (UPF0502 family)
MGIRDFLDHNLPAEADTAQTSATQIHAAAAEHRRTTFMAGVEDDLINLSARVAMLEVHVRELQNRLTCGGA